MNMKFSDIMNECRARGTRAIQWLESIIMGEMYNQPLRIVYTSLSGQDNNSFVLTGLYNTLSPFLFSAQYHLKPEEITKGVEMNKVTASGTLTNDLDMNMEQTRLLETVSDNMVIVSEDDASEAVLVNVVAESNPMQPSENTEISESAKEEVFEMDAVLDDNPGKSGKKHKKKTILGGSLSVFTLWLLDQKPLESNTSNWQKKAGKKGKVNESAQKSITPSDEIISESLALILKKQGHYLEAKKMYKKLLLKFPEKAQDYEAEIKELNTFL